MSKKSMNSVFHALISCKIHYTLCAWVVTLLRPTRGKLMPSYAGCIVMDMWVQSIILTTWYVLLMLNCFRRCVKCIIALIIFCLKWKLPIIHCVKGITILSYLLRTSLFRNSFVIRCLFKFKWTVVMSFCPFLHVRLLYANKYTYIWGRDGRLVSVTGLGPRGREFVFRCR